MLLLHRQLLRRTFILSVAGRHSTDGLLSLLSNTDAISLSIPVSLLLRGWLYCPHFCHRHETISGKWLVPISQQNSYSSSLRSKCRSLSHPNRVTCFPHSILWTSRFSMKEGAGFQVHSTHSTLPWIAWRKGKASAFSCRFPRSSCSVDTRLFPFSGIHFLREFEKSVYAQKGKRHVKTAGNRVFLLEGEERMYREKRRWKYCVCTLYACVWIYILDDEKGI